MTNIFFHSLIRYFICLSMYFLFIYSSVYYDMYVERGSDEHEREREKKKRKRDVERGDERLRQSQIRK